MKGQDGLRLQPHIDVSEGNPTWMPLNVKGDVKIKRKRNYQIWVCFPNMEN